MGDAGRAAVQVRRGWSTSRVAIGLLVVVVVAFVASLDGARAAHAATSNIFVINSLGDAPDANTADGLCQTATGDCTLRAAIQQADADPRGSSDEIDFGVPGQVTLTGPLPALTNSMFITGTTSKNTVRRGDGNGSYRIFTVTNGAAADLENLIVTNGVVNDPTDQCGGGIHVVAGATLQLTASTVSLNQAVSGGGICAEGSTTITGSTIASNAALANLGGGVYASSSLKVTSSSIETNQAGDGGGIFNAGGGQLSLVGVTLLDNASDGSSPHPIAHGGGGIYNFFGASAAVLDSTLTGNSASGSLGGGILSAETASLTIVNSTVAGNTAATGGGIDDAASGADTFQNTLVARNTATVTAPDIASGSTSGGHNLIGNGTGAPGFVNGVNGDKVGTALTPVDAKLDTDSLGNVVIKDNGGPTHTIALLAGSPAIDAGSDTVVGSPYNLTTDQRGPGFARLQGAHVDIGAFEITPAPK